MGKLNDALTAYDEAKQCFPDDVISCCGYAETLRDLRRSQEAVQFYEEVLQRFVGDRVANNALACLLVEVGNPKAKKLVEVSSPRSKADWRDFHVMAMMELWGGNYPQARKLLDIGQRDCPFYEDRAVFECTLAALNLKERKQQSRLNTVDLDKGIIPFPASLIIYVHLEAENRRFANAEAGLQTIYIPKLQPATLNLKRLYGLAGERRVQPWQEEYERSALWEEERRLLLYAA
jgi:tetratricopeptide (TPR) repeat protein